MKLSLLTYLGNIGVKKEYQPWQAYLTRKINLSSALGFFNVILALTLFLIVGYNKSVLECVVVLFLAPLVFLLNIVFGYIAAAYLFTFIGCFLFYFLAVKMGKDSFAFLHYLPLIIGLLQMLGRRETFVHMIIMFVMCLASIILLLVSYQYNFFEVEITDTIVSKVRYVNIFFSFFTSMGFMIIIKSEAIKQEKQLENVIQQKEILLAELFHRVKNNLNIMSSLLNLKKENVSSEEAKRALEESRNLIFSMSLVHNKIYNSNALHDLNLGEYLEDLGKELINTIGGKGTASLEMNSVAIHLGISQAIPCGLIMNELVTNTFKHGREEGKLLKIEINLAFENGLAKIIYRDNGPGITESESGQKTLGMELINSLCDQLNGECTFENKKGFEFNLSFKP